MKCVLCKRAVEETFLKKPIGTFMKDKKGKRHLVCSECQKKFATKEELLGHL